MSIGFFARYDQKKVSSFPPESPGSSVQVPRLQKPPLRKLQGGYQGLKGQTTSRPISCEASAAPGLRRPAFGGIQGLQVTDLTFSLVTSHLGKLLAHVHRVLCGEDPIGSSSRVESLCSTSLILNLRGNGVSPAKLPQSQGDSPRRTCIGPTVGFLLTAHLNEVPSVLIHLRCQIKLWPCRLISWPRTTFYASPLRVIPLKNAGYINSSRGD